MEIKIKPAQLTIYLMMAREYAKTHLQIADEQDMPLLNKLIREICKVTWDEGTSLTIKESE